MELRVNAGGLFERLTRSIAEDVNITREAIEPEFSQFFEMSATFAERVRKQNFMLANAEQVCSDDSLEMDIPD